jgi:hypothetical protein
MIRVEVYTGIGAWKVHAAVHLCAAPHVGDSIDVHDRTITCDTVVIYKDHVHVEEKRPFQSEQDAKDFFK